jgi:hypothetical protein
MASTERITKVLDSKPVYALVGASELALGALRGLQSRVGDTALDRLTRRVDTLHAEVAALPARAQATVVGVAGQADQAYAGLARRGEARVRGVRDEAASQLAPSQPVLDPRPAEGLPAAEEPASTKVSRTTAARTTAARTTARKAGTRRASAPRAPRAAGPDPA